MCNILTYMEWLDKKFAEWAEEQGSIKLQRRYRVPPSEPAPVVTMHHGKPKLSLKNFGLATKKGRQMMARGETVEKLPMFREAFRAKRCLILVTGFYDSLDMGAYKQPWHIRFKDGGAMGFAGLWEERPNEENFTIVSAPANRVVSRVIDRMPVILPEPLWKRWLDPTAGMEELKGMLVPYADEPMEAYPVTRNVNKKGFDGPECVEPVVPDQGELDMF
jgi:putative SOS response-associated peptidase YedK